jgi:hypothetical protein
MMALLAFFLIFPQIHAMQNQFSSAQQLAQERAKEAELQIKSARGKSETPQFQEGFRINQDETAKSFEHAQNSEAGKAIFGIHRERGMYKFDENDPLISKSEEYHRDPQKLLNEIETRSAGENDYSIEYCEECSDEEYLVMARKTKKRQRDAASLDFSSFGVADIGGNYSAKILVQSKTMG